MEKQEARNPALGHSPARPLGPPGAMRSSSHRDPHPSQHSSSVFSCLTPGQHLLVPAAQPSTCPIVLGQSPFGNWRHPTPCLLLISQRLNLLLPRHPHNSLKSSTVPKPQGTTPNPIKHRCTPGLPKNQMFTSHPPLPPPPNKETPALGRGLMEEQEAATSCRGKGPWLPSLPASCSNHLFCFYFRKRWGSAP